MGAFGGERVERKGQRLRIKEVYIKNFGKFHRKEISFSPGINIVYGENESGKSTLHEFLKAMFFGLKKMRGRAAKTDSFHLYQPWEGACDYGGSLRFVCDEKVFRLDRDFDSMKSSLICQTDGEELSTDCGDLDILLGNISKTVFDNTVSFSQLKIKTEAGLLQEIKKHIVNFKETGDSSLNPEQAIRLLLTKKKEMEKELQGQEEKRLLDYRERSIYCSYREKEIEELEEKLAMASNEAKERKKRAQAALEKEQSNRKRRLLGLGGFLLLSTLIGLNLLLKDIFLRLGLSLFFAVAGLFFLGKLSKNHKEEDSFSEEIRHIEWTLLQLEKDREEKKEEYKRLKEELAFLPPNSEEEIRLKEEKRAINLAIETIRLICEKIEKSRGREIEETMSEILEEVTRGKYCRIRLGEDFSLQIEDRWRTLEERSLSVGTLHLVYFAFRMAADKILCKEEILPLFLDEAFSMYDEKRLQMLFGWLARQKRQVLIFTCQRREEDILVKSGIPFHKITL